MQLDVLLAGAEAARRGAPALEVIVECLAQASARTEFFVGIYRTHPALELGACIAACHGKILDLSGLPQAFAQSPTFFDRWSVEAAQRNRWQEYADSSGSPALRRYWTQNHEHRTHRFRRIVLCQGARPLAYVSAALRDGDGWSSSELARINRQYRKISGALRLTALAWRDRHHPEDWSSRWRDDGRGVLVVGRTGAVLAASPQARAWLAQDPELAAVAGEQRPGAPRRSHRLRHFRLEAQPLTGAAGARWQLLACQRERALPIEAEPRSELGLSPRERELLAWLAQGASNQEIAEQMLCRPSTIKTMLERLYDRFEVRGRVQLLASLRTSSAT